MASHRYIPFGYQISAGAKVHPEESKIVKFMFKSYLLGKSYKQISTELTDQKVEFCEGRYDWNKNRVKRILEDERYTGTDKYPIIIEPKTFSMVQTMIDKKCSKDYLNPQESVVRARLCCGECGKRYKKSTPPRGTIRWQCSDSNCNPDYYFTPQHLQEAIISTLNEVINNPELLNVETPKDDGFKPNTKTIKINNQISNMLRQEGNTNSNDITSLILQGVMERYDACTIDTSPYTTDTLKQEYHDANITDQIQPQLIEKSVSSIMVGHDGQIQIKFINGTIVCGQISK